MPRSCNLAVLLAGVVLLAAAVHAGSMPTLAELKARAEALEPELVELRREVRLPRLTMLMQ
jgi:hypothetical protein